jgi:branched-chain amino acid transport system ATP-binding protein
MTGPEAAPRAESAEPILRLRGVGRRFGGVHAVRDVDLEVRPGERRAILGPNGAGKTTLFNVISGEVPPTSGTVELFGSDLTDQPARARAPLGVSRTFQTSRLFLELSVEDNLYLAVLGARRGHLRAVRSRQDEEIREQGREVAKSMGLGDVLERTTSDLSHGEQRQLEVAMARAADPKLMLLDEPAAGLSRGERARVTELLESLDPDITLILIEHDMDVALRVAQWVTMMDDGRVIASGTPAEIRANETVHELYLGRRYAEEGAGS